MVKPYAVCGWTNAETGQLSEEPYNSNKGLTGYSVRILESKNYFQRSSKVQNLTKVSRYADLIIAIVPVIKPPWLTLSFLGNHVNVNVVITLTAIGKAKDEGV